MLNPYVGPRPFETGQALYGRERETLDLVRQLSAERIVLLHSPSGAGKTSLVQAALIPQLEARKFLVLPVIRVSLADRTLAPDANPYLASVFSSLESERPKEQQPPITDLLQLGLPAYLDQRQAEWGEKARPILIFDQFEEILTLSPADLDAKQEFFRQVGEAFEDKRRWALFVMREDFVAALDPYRDFFPNRLASTFRLDLLDEADAREAIQNPAQAEGVAFTDEAAHKLVDDLRQIQVQRPDGTVETQPGPYVEPVQLQVVCHRLWEQMPAGTSAITPESVAAVGSVDAALAAYYEDKVRATLGQTGVSERAIREWVGQRLITPQGIRGQVLQGHDISEGLPNRAIQMLIDGHLVRAEKRRGATWYELAHDRLVEPVKRSNVAWRFLNFSLLQRQAELWADEGRAEGLLLRGTALAEAEAWAAAHAAELTGDERAFLEACRKALAMEEMETRRRAEEARAHEAERAAARARRLSSIIAGVSVIALIAAITAVVFGIQSSQNSAIANQNAATAQADKATAQAARLEAEFQKANALIQQATAQAASTQAFAEKKRAEEAETEAESRRLAAEAHGFFANQLDLGLLLSIEAGRVATTTAALGALRDGLYTNPRLSTFLRGDGAPVWDVAFSPDSKLLASADDNGTINLWDPVTRQRLNQLRSEESGFSSGLGRLAFSQDSKLLAVTTIEGQVTLLDVSTSQPISRSLASSTSGQLYGVSFSPDGKILAAGGVGGIFLWDVTTGELITETSPEALNYGGSPQFIAVDVAFSPDGQTLATADLLLGQSENSFTGTVGLWEFPSLKPIPLTDNSADFFFSMAFSPDGNTLAAGACNQGNIASSTPNCSESEVRLWDIATRKLAGKIPTTHTNLIFDVAFSPDGQTVATSSFDKTISLWNVQTQQLVGQSLTGHSNWVLGIAFSPDGQTLASASQDGNVILWNTNPSRALIRQTTLSRLDLSPVSSLALSPDSRLIAVSSYASPALALWDTNTGQMVGNSFGDQETPNHLAFSPDGKTLASSSCAKLDPQGTCLQIGIFLWDVSTKQERQVIRVDNSIVSLAFSLDGRSLAASSCTKFDEQQACSQNGIFLWNVSTGEAVSSNPWAEYATAITSLAFSSDSKRLASGSSGTVIVWDIQTGRPVVSQTVSNQTVQVLAFSPDNATIAIGATGGVLLLWDSTQPKAVVRRLSGHSGDLQSLAFNLADGGKTLVSASADGTIIVWDVSSGQIIGNPMKDGDHGVLSVAFSQDGKALLSVSENEVVFWRSMDFGSFPARACEVANRNLTQIEWAQYFPGQLYQKTCDGLPDGN